MIYTIGHRKNYLDSISRNNGYITKLGKREPPIPFPQGYAGGVVFLTKEDAQAGLDAHNQEVMNAQGSNQRVEPIGIDADDENVWAIFGVDADWDQNTYQVDGEPHRHLIRDAMVIILPESLGVDYRIIFERV